MDSVGRKASLLAFSIMSLFVGWTMVMAASQSWQLYVGRLLLGLGVRLPAGGRRVEGALEGGIPFRD